MNPILLAELHRLDHQERLHEAENWRLSRQLKQNGQQPQRLLQLWKRLNHLLRPHRSLELAQ
jgi:hypothetical protein